MREKLFDVIQRNECCPRDFAESTFDFLNRVKGDYWDEVRLKVQEWLDEIPSDEDYKDLRGRLRSADDEQFKSAYLETYLHACFLRAGYKVNIHPTIQGSAKHPDFLIEKNGQGVYIEAIVPGKSRKQIAEDRRYKDFLEGIDRADTGDFYLRIGEIRVGKTSAPVATVRRELESWLRGLDSDSQSESFESQPVYKWKNDDWYLKVFAIPRKHRRECSRRRAIGITEIESGVLDDAPAIKKCLEYKRKRYGALDKPLVIVVGTNNPMDYMWDVKNALFGKDCIVFQGGIAVSSRRTNGFYGYPNNWRNKEVSGVLIVNNLNYNSYYKSENSLILHPQANFPLPYQLGIPGDILQVEGNYLKSQNKISGEEFFRIEGEWPDEKPFADCSRVAQISGNH